MTSPASSVSSYGSENDEPLDDGRGDYHLEFSAGERLQHDEVDLMLVAKLGAGGFGSIFSVVDLNATDNKEKALKVSAEGAEEKARQEGRLMRQIQDGATCSPVVWCHAEMDTTKYDEPYVGLVLDLMQSNLADFRESLLPPDMCLDRFTSFFLAEKLYTLLADLHSREVAHFDLKPKNILIGFQSEEERRESVREDAKKELRYVPFTSVNAARRLNKWLEETPAATPTSDTGEGDDSKSIMEEFCEGVPTIKLCDLGLARNMSEGDTQFSGGTRLYMAPEVVVGGPCDLPCDVFSMGVTLFEVVTGRPLFGEAEDLLPQMLAVLGPLPQGTSVEIMDLFEEEEGGDPVTSPTLQARLEDALLREGTGWTASTLQRLHCVLSAALKLDWTKRASAAELVDMLDEEEN